MKHIQWVKLINTWVFQHAASILLQRRVVREETIAFPTGETRTLNRIALTSPPEMVAKEKRVSTTVFAQKRSLRTHKV